MKAPVGSRGKPAELELSIGALSAATGVPVETLRTWERRYGFPEPTNRTGGSHRRYAAETVGAVQLIVQALERGHRPADVVGRTPEALRRLLRAASPQGASVASTADREVIARWLAATEAFDAEGLNTEFQRGLAALPALDFLERRMAPYLVEVGARWARGELRVSHEHFASERAREFLSNQWRGVADGIRRPKATLVLSTLPGEEHVLGLHMAAWAFALAQAKLVFLGADTPVAETAFAAERHAADGVVLSVAAGYAGDVGRHVKDLCERLPAGVSVVMGGSGVPPVPRPARHLNRFSRAADWVENLARAGAVDGA